MCQRFVERAYYIVLAVLFFLTMIMQLVTIGTFTVQHSRTNSFYRENLGTRNSSSVCVLYGEEMSVGDKFNVALDNDASCGFVIFGILIVVIVLLVFMVAYVFLGIAGKPRM